MAEIKLRFTFYTRAVRGMEQIVGKLVARVCYVSKKILEEVQESEQNELSESIEEKFTMCRTDTSKTLQICTAIRSSPVGAEVYNSVKMFESLLAAFENNCIAFCNNRFDFQLRQTIQSSQKELGIQLNTILTLLDTMGPEDKTPTNANQSEDEIGSCARNVALTLRKLSEEANKSDVQNFIGTAKQAFKLMKELQQVLLHDGSVEATTFAQKIGKLSLMVIRAGKELCQHPGDTTRHEFSLAKQAIAQSLQQVLFYAKKMDEQPTVTKPSIPERSELSKSLPQHFTVNEENIAMLKQKIESEMEDKQETAVESTKSEETAEQSLTSQEKIEPETLEESASDDVEAESEPQESQKGSTIKRGSRRTESGKESPKKKITRSKSSKPSRRTSVGLLSRKMKPMKGKAVKEAITNLQNKPMFLLHKSQQGPLPSETVGRPRSVSEIGGSLDPDTGSSSLVRWFPFLFFLISMNRTYLRCKIQASTILNHFLLAVKQTSLGKTH